MKHLSSKWWQVFFYVTNVWPHVHIYFQNIQNFSRNVYVSHNIRLCLVVKGSALWQIGDRLVPVKEGDVAILNNHVKRVFKEVSEATGIELLIVEVEPQLFMNQFRGLLYGKYVEKHRSLYTYPIHCLAQFICCSKGECVNSGFMPGCRIRNITIDACSLDRTLNADWSINLNIYIFRRYTLLTKRRVTATDSPGLFLGFESPIKHNLGQRALTKHACVKEHLQANGVRTFLQEHVLFVKIPDL